MCAREGTEYTLNSNGNIQLCSLQHNGGDVSPLTKSVFS